MNSQLIAMWFIEFLNKIIAWNKRLWHLIVMKKESAKSELMEDIFLAWKLLDMSDLFFLWN